MVEHNKEPVEGIDYDKEYMLEEADRFLKELSNLEDDIDEVESAKSSLEAAQSELENNQAENIWDEWHDIKAFRDKVGFDIEPHQFTTKRKYELGDFWD